MKRNIPLLIVIQSLYSAWFWLGIWIPYYLLFTNYAGVGIIEMVVFILVFVLEIPTGAFADIVGKKKTLMIALFLSAFGQLFMGFAQSFWYLIISIVILGFASALNSGTYDALMYDSLKTLKREKEYDKIYSRLQVATLVVMALCSAVGGYLYTINPRLPFILTGIFVLIGFVFTFFLKEPPIDTVKYSFKAYLKQNIEGFRELFRVKEAIPFIFLILGAYSFSHILMEVLDPSLLIAFSFTEAQMGVIYAFMPIISAIGVYLYPQIVKRFGKRAYLIFTFGTLIIATAISPFIGMVTALISLSYRNFFYQTIATASSDTINSFVDSKYRATTLSTFNMLKNLPYVIAAYGLGYLTDTVGAKDTVMWLSIVYAGVFVIVAGWALFKRTPDLKD